MRAEDEATKTPSGTPSVITDLEKSRRCVLIHWITNFGEQDAHGLTESPRGLLGTHVNHKGILCH